MAPHPRETRAAVARASPSSTTLRRRTREGRRQRPQRRAVAPSTRSARRRANERLVPVGEHPLGASMHAAHRMEALDHLSTTRARATTVRTTEGARAQPPRSRPARRVESCAPGRVRRRRRHSRASAKKWARRTRSSTAARSRSQAAERREAAARPRKPRDRRERPRQPRATASRRRAAAASEQTCQARRRSNVE